MQSTYCFAWCFWVENAMQVPPPVGDDVLEVQEVAWIKKRTRGIMLLQPRKERSSFSPVSLIVIDKKAVFHQLMPLFP